MALITKARAEYHSALRRRLYVTDSNGVPTNADKSQTTSTRVARHLASTLQVPVGTPLPAQTAGNEFERVTAEFLKRTFLKLGNLRPGAWDVHHVKSRSGVSIAQYEQYSHLGDIEKAAQRLDELRVLLGLDYSVASDVVIARHPESDAVINKARRIVNSRASRGAVLRDSSGARPTLHACISCKWTMRSDRAQNARAEALNLIRSRRGRTPHIVVVTGESLPSRLASLALGTGDIDCVYHIALPELIDAVATLTHAKHAKLLDLMIRQKRLKDISDLPLDLVV